MPHTPGHTPEGQSTPEGWQIATEASANPTIANLASLSQFAIYMRADKFVIAYNNAGTITYIKIAMDGSATTIVHNTTVP